MSGGETQHAWHSNLVGPMSYSGIRVTLGGTLSRSVVRFHVDVNVGDLIWPAPQQISVPGLIDGVIVVRGYPLEMVNLAALPQRASPSVLRIRVGYSIKCAGQRRRTCRYIGVWEFVHRFLPAAAQCPIQRHDVVDELDVRLHQSLSICQ